jgi:hypothetical protein
LKENRKYQFPSATHWREAPSGINQKGRNKMKTLIVLALSLLITQPIYALDTTSCKMALYLGKVEGDQFQKERTNNIQIVVSEDGSAQTELNTFPTFETYSSVSSYIESSDIEFKMEKDKLQLSFPLMSHLGITVANITVISEEIDKASQSLSGLIDYPYMSYGVIVVTK